MKIKLIMLLFFASINAKKIEILHLSFHKGCINSFKLLEDQFNLKVESWFIPDLPRFFFDPACHGNALYNIGHDRAERIWNKHKDYFNKFDAIVTSDTVPLSRIFLQNKFQKPLIVWICNRFDYSDASSLDCQFPDPQYYQLLNEATQKENVFFVSYS
ncbi:MAG: hypothetical protein P4L22_01390, partial [Candidatus Babeliales bacterium]|nr:hypothetical protein [Candidatus Babeliales bacterium]